MRIRQSQVLEGGAGRGGTSAIHFVGTCSSARRRNPNPPSLLVEGGPEPLENEFLGNVRTDFRTLFLGSATKYLFSSFLVPASAQSFLLGPVGHESFRRRASKHASARR